MSQFSPYAISQSEPPKWMPQEDMAAAAFIGIALWLVFDTSFCIIRVFKTKKGLYYWSMALGIGGCGLDAVGVIVKYLTPGTKKIWPLYTLMLLTGWGVYAPAQLMVLYSRLHLVNNTPRVQRWVLGSIISTLFIFVLPTWVVIWHSYNPDFKQSSTWSPRTAIIERYTQIGFTIVECIVSGVYISSLLGLLNHKSTVRQRRVMLDLIYVNIIAIAFDVIVVIFIYLNRLGVSHPIQTFSYALKLKLEFVVLNQLMAVAARGMQKHPWEERRYHNADPMDDFSAECRKWAEKSSVPPIQADEHSEESPDCEVGNVSEEISKPSSVSSRSSRTSTILQGQNGNFDPTNLDTVNFGAEPKLELQTLYDERDSRMVSAPTLQTMPSQTFSGETLQPPEDAAREESPHLFPRHPHRGQRKRLPLVRRHTGHGEHSRHISGSSAPINATPRRPKPGRRRNDEDENDEAEIGVHMWENRGKLILDAPWFKTKEGV
ncbi:MAG: hypothetical protein Q9164_004374 [Protoblastenia rupestris]